MPDPAPLRAGAAKDTFLATLTSEATRRQRRAFLEEYIAHLASLQQTHPSRLSTADLLDETNIDTWLAAAHRGATRRRPGPAGPHTPASTNSMAARVSTLNAFSHHYGTPLHLTPPRPHFADRLTPTEAHRTLRLLAAHQPAGMLQPTWERSVALIALAICTGHGITALHPMRLEDLELDRPLPLARVRNEWYPLDPVSHHALTRWHTTHHALTAGHLKTLHGGNVNQLWVTTTPGRPRTGTTAPPAGLPAAVRTLESAHRKLTSTTLGTPLLLEQFCTPETEGQ